MLLGAVADDFTGAGDLANTLSRGGMATTLFLGVPQSPAAADCQAGVVALKTRSIEPAAAVAQSLAALRWLRRQGTRQNFFKYCSTFDSTPAGNIGPVAEAMLDELHAPVAVVCPALPETGRRVFMGHLFVNDRLLNESGMEKHPVTPMTDPDIRRWLARQTRGAVGFIPLATVEAGPAAIRDALAREEAAGRRLVVTDAVRDDDLLKLGAALADALLVTGGSGIALGLPRNFAEVVSSTSERAAAGGVPGPACVLSGSCSSASLRQVAAYRSAHPALAVSPGDLMEGRMTPADALGFVSAHLAESPIVYSTATPAEVGEAQRLYGGSAVASSVEGFFAALAPELLALGVRRLVVGGGETSGAVVSALGLTELRVGREIDPGVPLLFTTGGRRLGLALKSGNFGSADFFAKALEMLQP